MKRSVSSCLLLLLLLTAAVAAHPIDKKPVRERRAHRSERSVPAPDSAANSAAVAPRQVMPGFMDGGIEDFRTWIGRQVAYSEEMYRLKLEGRVTVVFVVGRDGSIRITDVLESPDLLLTNEVVRVLRTSPRWTPGLLFNEKTQAMDTIPVQFILPVDFNLRKPDK